MARLIRVVGRLVRLLDALGHMSYTVTVSSGTPTICHRNHPANPLKPDLT